MGKMAGLYAGIEPDVKEQAESILSALGISAPNAINMFYKQIILHRGIPFEMKLPAPNVPDMSRMSDEQIDLALEEGYRDILNGRVKPASTVFESIRREYGI